MGVGAAISLLLSRARRFSIKENLVFQPFASYESCAFYSTDVARSSNLKPSNVAYASD